jgi:hypothetical protein
MGRRSSITGGGNQDCDGSGQCTASIADLGMPRWSRVDTTCSAPDGLLAGCATPYQSQGLMGGFDETQIAPNVWRVSFKGNGYTSPERAENLALLRSADLTLRSGFSYFGLASARVGSSVSAFTTPVTTTTTASAHVVGNSAYGRATSTSYGGDTFFVSKPSANNTVVMFREKPEVSGMVYDAQFICDSVGTKYKAQCGAKRGG